MKSLLNIFGKKLEKPSEGENKTSNGKSYPFKYAELAMLEIARSFPSNIEAKGYGIGNSSKINRIIIPEPIGVSTEERHPLDAVMSLRDHTHIFIAVNQNANKLGILMIGHPFNGEFKGGTTRFIERDRIITPVNKILAGYLSQESRNVHFSGRDIGQISDQDLMYKVLGSPFNRIHDEPTSDGWERIIFLPNTVEQPGLIVQANQVGAKNAYYISGLALKEILSAENNQFQASHCYKDATSYLDIHIHESSEKNKAEPGVRQMMEDVDEQYFALPSPFDVLQGATSSSRMETNLGLRTSLATQGIIALTPHTDPANRDIMKVTYTNLDALLDDKNTGKYKEYYRLASVAEKSNGEFNTVKAFFQFSKKLEAEGIITEKPPVYVDTEYENINNP